MPIIICFKDCNVNKTHHLIFLHVYRVIPFFRFLDILSKSPDLITNHSPVRGGTPHHLLIRCQECLVKMGFHFHRPFFGHFLFIGKDLLFWMPVKKIIRLNHLSIQQAQYKPVTDQAPVFFHQITAKGRSAITDFVQRAQIRVKPAHFFGTNGLYFSPLNI